MENQNRILSNERSSPKSEVVAARRYFDISDPMTPESFYNMLTQECILHINPFVETTGMCIEFVKAVKMKQVKAYVIWRSWTIGKPYDESYDQNKISWHDAVYLCLEVFTIPFVHGYFHLRGPVFYACGGIFKSIFPVENLICQTGGTEFDCPLLTKITSMDGIFRPEYLMRHQVSLTRLVINQPRFKSLMVAIKVKSFPNLKSLYAPIDYVDISDCPNLEFVSAIGIYFRDIVYISLKEIKCDQYCDLFEGEYRDWKTFKQRFPSLNSIRISPGTRNVIPMFEYSYRFCFPLILEHYDSDAEFVKSENC